MKRGRRESTILSSLPPGRGGREEEEGLCEMEDGASSEGEEEGRRRGRRESHYSASLTSLRRRGKLQGGLGANPEVKA